MQRSKRLVHDRPDDPEATIMPCCINIVTAPATQAQSHAWSCLWRMLLMEKIDTNRSQARGNEGEHHAEK
jgi:hypothetical protein